MARRHYGEVTHDPRKVGWAAQRTGMRGSRRFKIDVTLYRYGGGFEAFVCIPKGPLNLGPAQSYRYKRLAPRCGRAHAASPTRALRGALARLTRVTR